MYTQEIAQYFADRLLNGGLKVQWYESYSTNRFYRYSEN